MAKPRRRYTAEFKVRVVLELISGKKSVSQASQEYGVKESVLSRWRDEFLERAPQIFEQPGQEDEQAKRIAELERLAGDMAVQLEMAKKVLGSSDFVSKRDE